MRLEEAEIAGIRAAVAEVYGPGASVKLFGSRLDDGARGGDIDLLVETPAQPEVAQEIALGAALEARLGARKIDVLVVGPEGARRPVERAAMRDGDSLPDVAAPEGGEEEDLLAASLEGAEMFAGRLRRSVEAVRAEPLKAPFDEAAQERVDALFKRFERLQDVCLRRLARHALAAAQEDARGMTARDQLNRLEQLGATSSAARWLKITAARNRIAMDYGDRPGVEEERLKAVLSAADALLEEWALLDRFARAQAEQRS